MTAIRPYVESDENAVIQLWTSAFGYTSVRNQPATVIRCKLEVQRELFFVAVRDDRIIGTVLGGYDGHRGWIYSLAVDEQSQRQRVGTALLKHLEEALRGRGCLKINLQVIPSNSAVEFYQKLGYAAEEQISMGKLLG